MYVYHQDVARSPGPPRIVQPRRHAIRRRYSLPRTVQPRRHAIRCFSPSRVSAAPRGRGNPARVVCAARASATRYAGAQVNGLSNGLSNGHAVNGGAKAEAQAVTVELNELRAQLVQIDEKHKDKLKRKPPVSCIPRAARRSRACQAPSSTVAATHVPNHTLLVAAGRPSSSARDRGDTCRGQPGARRQAAPRDAEPGG